MSVTYVSFLTGFVILLVSVALSAALDDVRWVSSTLPFLGLFALVVAASDGQD